MYWHEATPDRWNQEQFIASRLLNNFKAEVDVEQTAIIRGVFDVSSENGHIYESVALRIEYPPKFPIRNTPPSIYLESHHDCWKNTIDSHIESDWRLCLYVPGESKINHSEVDSLKDLIAVLHTFLFKQRIYQRRLAKSHLIGEVIKWPGEERSHGDKGILEAIQSRGGIGRNDPCPCGGGKKYKHCHLVKLTGN